MNKVWLIFFFCTISHGIVLDKQYLPMTAPYIDYAQKAVFNAGYSFISKQFDKYSFMENVGLFLEKFGRDIYNHYYSPACKLTRWSTLCV